LLLPVCEGLKDRARVHWIQDADHSFHVPKRSGRTDADVLTELGEAVVEWLQKLC
jgi:predicted alpha/beta-hydrolase family hydrolase